MNKDTPVLRTWTDATGRYKAEARFGGEALGKVTLLKEDGTKAELPLEKLSDSDREWIGGKGEPRPPDKLELRSGGSLGCVVLQEDSDDVAILYHSSVLRPAF